MRRMPGVLGLALLPALLLAACGGASGQTSLGAIPVGMTADARETYYTVTGSNAGELRRAMRAAGPFRDGRRFDGYTDYNIRWRFRYAPRGMSCTIVDATVDYRVTITLPRWSPPPDAPAELVQAWEEFTSALRRHEEGHRDLGAQAAREILRELRRVQTPGCTSIAAQANATGQRILNIYRERQRRYDGDTRHGMAQGVRWPPRADPP